MTLLHPGRKRKIALYAKRAEGNAEATVAAIARRLGVSRPWVQLILEGKRTAHTPRAAEIRARVAELLGVTVAEAFPELEEHAEPAPAEGRQGAAA